MNRPPHGRIGTLDQDDKTKMDEFLIMDRPPNGRNQTIDQDYPFEVDEWTDF